ncbi:MAG TPA: hypothetical protein VHY19_04830 [Steroidobacteraceae bacterium]|nr:hypothetical protein [Steroidobacteraceae bacterium]
MNSTLPVTLVLLASLGVQSVANAQGRRGGGPVGPPPSAEAGAPIDLTGYWTSIITFDWRFRMVTPPPGDYEAVPLTASGKEVMNAWDPAKDTAAGEQCKSYGAPIIMRVPGHLHVTWQDEQTMKMEIDTGEQTRLFHFVPSPGDAHSPPSLQGYSAAAWDQQGRGRQKWGQLKVTTADLKPGYIRKNGIPYSDKTSVLEYFDLVPGQYQGETIMTVTSVVTDPVYLFQPFTTDDIFSKLSSGDAWKPTACSATW